MVGPKTSIRWGPPGPSLGNTALSDRLLLVPTRFKGVCPGFVASTVAS